MIIVHDKSLIKGVGFGIIGGFIGTFLMDIVMMLTFVIAGKPAETFFTMVGEKLGDGAFVGVLVHNLVGITGGIIVSLLVLTIEPLRIDSRRKGLMIGVAAGAVTIPLGCIPLAIWLDQAILDVIAFSILPHLVWGTVVGLVISYGLLSYGQDSQEKRNRSTR